MIFLKCLRQAQAIVTTVRNANHVRLSCEVNRFFRSSSITFTKDNTEDEFLKKYKISNDSSDIPSFLSGRFEVFREENAPVILDVEEEQRKHIIKTDNSIKEFEEPCEEFQGVDLERGIHGVFDVEQLVDLLQSEGAVDLCVIKLPIELKYAEHLVIVTGRSARHRKALAQLVRRVFKKKSLPSEHIPRIEGAHSDGTNFDWLAMDLGNIVLHIFARNTREKYDLESLWTLGSDHDVQYNKPDDPLIALLGSHSVYLGDLEPVEPNLSSTTRDPEEPKT